jgi:hypothetical protein
MMVSALIVAQTPQLMHFQLHLLWLCIGVFLTAIELNSANRNDDSGTIGSTRRGDRALMWLPSVLFRQSFRPMFAVNVVLACRTRESFPRWEGDSGCHLRQANKRTD